MKLVSTLLFILLALAPAAHSADVPNIAVAANMSAAMPAIAEAFAKASGRSVRIAYGSSGNFRRQIAQGAPFQLFLSADEAYAEALAKDGHAENAGAVYAVGRLAFYVPQGSPVGIDNKLKDLGTAAADGRLKRLAIANPDLAPYGRAAREALERVDLWNGVKGKLVLGESVGQAARFLATGEAQAGFIPLALAAGPELKTRGAWATVPESWHAPLRQRMVLIKGAGDTARRFYDFLLGPQAQALLRQHGYAAPSP
jgi:molybdate transport system substrate-binding protein